MGSWMVADSLYEAGAPEFFHLRSQQSYQGWQTLASNFKQAPLRTTGHIFAPGLTEALTHPHDPEAWGRATFDTALLFPLFKTSKLGRVGNFSNPVLARSRLASSSSNNASRFLIHPELASFSTVRRPIWTATKQRSSIENAFFHWKKHQYEFPEFHNSLEYVKYARNRDTTLSMGTYMKIKSGGDLVLYDNPANTFIVKDRFGVPKTMFKPTPEKHGFRTNLEYFDAQ